MNQFITRLLFLCVVTFGPTSANVLAVEPQAPLEMIKKTADRMLVKLKEDEAIIRKDPTRIYALVSDIVLPRFDFERMASWVLGKHWRTATPVQREKFIEEFRNLLVRTYATSLTDYTDRTITYLPVRADPGATEVIVRTAVEQAGAAAIPIDYSVALKNGEWKVYDVAIDGVSLVTNYRTSFSNEIRKSGLDKLIVKLAQRNQTNQPAPAASAPGPVTPAKPRVQAP